MQFHKTLTYIKLSIVSIIALLSVAQSSCAQAKKDLKGWDMTNYKFIDKTGKPMSISALRGKYVFIDVWASWCRPCINKFPEYDSLKTALKDKNIICLQVSIDARERRWRDGMGFNGRITDQWFTNEDPVFMKELEIAYIPRYILVDRKGKILEPKMDWKDNAQMIAFISRLKGI